MVSARGGGGGGGGGGGEEWVRGREERAAARRARMHIGVVDPIVHCSHAGTRGVAGKQRACRRAPTISREGAHPGRAPGSPWRAQLLGVHHGIDVAADRPRASAGRAARGRPSAMGLVCNRRCCQGLARRSKKQRAAIAFSIAVVIVAVNVCCAWLAVHELLAGARAFFGAAAAPPRARARRVTPRRLQLAKSGQERRGGGGFANAILRAGQQKRKKGAAAAARRLQWRRARAPKVLPVLRLRGCKGQAACARFASLVVALGLEHRRRRAPPHRLKA